MPKPVEEGIALLLFPFVVTACWFWLVDSFLLDNEERIEIDPVRSGRAIALQTCSRLRRGAVRSQFECLNVPLPPCLVRSWSQKTALRLSQWCR
jgi:hypothetical protein